MKLSKRQKALNRKQALYARVAKEFEKDLEVARMFVRDKKENISTLSVYELGAPKDLKREDYYNLNNLDC